MTILDARRGWRAAVSSFVLLVAACQGTAGSTGGPSGTIGGSGGESAPPAPLPTAPAPPFYVSAYYAPLKSSMIPIEDIDFGGITHLHYFGVRPLPSGELKGAVDAAVVRAAHAAKVPVVLTVGGSDSEADFLGAMAASQRGSFVANIVAMVTSSGLDGVDLDMEPILPDDDASFSELVVALRAALAPPLLLMSTVKWEKPLFASLQSSFDRLDLLTYHLLGDARVSWHNAALYAPALRAEATGEPLPSCDSEVRDALSSGIDPRKLSLGIDFNGSLWSGVSAPDQAASEKAATGLTFAQIVSGYDSSSARRWDDAAEVPYLSLDAGGGGQFVSYDDERSVAIKVGYAVSQRLGGVMVWNLGSDYLADAGAADREPLLTAVASAVASRDAGATDSDGR